MANYVWSETNPLELEIEGRKINLETKGIEYARQFGMLTSWLGRYALPALLSAAESGSLEGSSNFDMISNLLGDFMSLGFTPEAMVELAGIVINEDAEFVAENFDPGWFIETLLVSYDSRPGIRKAFSRILERFFLATQPNEGDEEDLPQD